MKKKALRKEIMALRNSLNETALEEKSSQIYDNLTNWPVFNNADSILIYMDFQNEVKTNKIIETCLKQNKDVIVPVVDETTQQMILIEIDGDTKFVKSKFGILEPAIIKDKTRSLYDVDLVLAPGVAFDLIGNRLGYGGGYYDRLLDAHSEIRHLIKVYGLAFECQLIDNVPAESTDYTMDGIVTEKKIYQCEK